MKEQPKHVLLSDWIRERIKNGTFPNGSKLLSENELALHFSYSRQTVRQAIGTLVNEGILERRRGSGTYVVFNRSKKQPMTNNIAVITTYLDSYVFPGVIQGIDRVLSVNGYNMKLGITYNKSKNEANVLESMLESGVDGFIIEPTKSALPNPNNTLYQEILKSGLPVLFINGYYSSLDIPCVSMDDYAGGRKNAQYLIDHGHEKLFGIFKSDDIQGHFRFSGFVNTIKENGLCYDDNSVLWFVTEDMEQIFDADNDERLLRRLENSTGIVCYNDEVASLLVEMLKRNGKSVPDDFSVVSFDNSNLATAGGLSLTTIDYKGDLIGQKAAKQMLELIHGAEKRMGYSVMPELVERDSVKGIKVKQNAL